MYYVGLCPLCKEGLLGIRICGALPLVLCDECDALWLSPPDVDEPPLILRADPDCPECGRSVWEEPAHWADRQEVENAGWWGLVAGEAGDREESGGPRTPEGVDPVN